MENVESFLFQKTHQKVNFHILILRSTLHLESVTVATEGDFLPLGGTRPLIPSQVTLIPTFLLFNPPAWTLTLVSIWIFRGIPLDFFRSARSAVRESVSRLDRFVETITPRKTVWFLGLLLNGGSVEFPTKTSVDRKVTVKVS